MRNLFSATRDTPGVCSPSRRVVSKNFMVLGKRLNKAIPHLNHISCFRVKHKYKNYGKVKKRKVKEFLENFLNLKILIFIMVFDVLIVSVAF
jgi:hypothetical protein